MHKFKSRSAQNVIGLKLSGTLSRAEYHEIVPYLEEKIKEYGKIRLLIELDHWEGWGAYAAFNDMYFVLKNAFKIERVAFLLKSEADKRAVLLAKPFTPWSRDTTRYFGPEETEAAWLWVGEGNTDFTIPGDKDFDLNEKEEKKKKVRYGPKQNILIIGGGVSGMTLAALLKQRGFDPTLVEMRDEALECDRTIEIWPNAAGVLKSLRLYKKTLKTASIISSFDVYDVKGAFIHRYDNVQFEEQEGPVLQLTRSKLIKIINKFLTPNVLRKAVAVTKLKEAKESVKVTFSDGTKGAYDCVICIDGLHSKMRELVFGVQSVNYSGMVGWFFSVKSDFDFPQGVITYTGGNGYIRLTKIGDRIYGFACVQSEDLGAKDKYLELLKSSFQNYPVIVKQVIDLVEEGNLMWHEGLRQNLPDSYVHGRIAFLEEAIFSFFPTTILGDSLALEAATVLAEELSRSDSERVIGALNNYQDYRLRRMTEVKKCCEIEELQALFHPESLEKRNSFLNEAISDEAYRSFWKFFLEEAF